MRRRLFWLLVALLFVAGAYFLANLPALYARVRLDRSYPALSRYVFETTPDVVLIGSSMTFRVYEGYFLNQPVRNISISGGSPLTGLAIVGSYDSLPSIAMVEANIMSRPVDPTLVEQFARNDAAPFQWFRPARAIISRVYYWIKTKSEADNVAKLPQLEPSDYDITASVAAFANEMNGAGLDAAIARNVAELKANVEAIERRGCRVVFYELPYPSDLAASHFAVLTRQLMHAAFPDRSNWSNLDFGRPDLRWVDANHMDERSAIIVAKQIEDYLTSHQQSGLIRTTVSF